MMSTEYSSNSLENEIKVTSCPSLVDNKISNVFEIHDEWPEKLLIALSQKFWYCHANIKQLGTNNKVATIAE